MSDITFMKGYGFPRGSQMDYAGYGMLVPTQRQRMNAYQRIPTAVEPSLFEKIPALDGMSEFGTEYTFTEEEAGGIDAGPIYGPEYRPDELRRDNVSGILTGLGLIGLAFLVLSR